MRFKTRSLASLMALTLLAVMSCARASIVITGTRIVYPESENEVTVKLSNEGSAPALVQAWLDSGDPKTLPGESKAPFTVAPPLFRLDPRKGQSLRLIYTREPLPQDKESVFWLNVLEVPPRDSGKDESPNKLQLAFRTRIKVFYRPATLAGNPDNAAALVRWRIVSKDGEANVLEAENPTPYHVTFSHLRGVAGSVHWVNENGGMVDPGAVMDFDVGALKNVPAGPAEVEYTYINDYGAGVKGRFVPTLKK